MPIEEIVPEETGFNLPTMQLLAAQAYAPDFMSRPLQNTPSMLKVDPLSAETESLKTEVFTDASPVKPGSRLLSQASKNEKQKAKPAVETKPTQQEALASVEVNTLKDEIAKLKDIINQQHDYQKRLEQNIITPQN